MGFTPSVRRRMREYEYYPELKESVSSKAVDCVRK